MNSDQAMPARPVPDRSGKSKLIWIIPLGCLGAVVLMVGFVMAIVLFVFSMMKSSDAYKEALASAQSNQAVMTALGTPITAGYLVSGNVNVSGATGEANLSIPISGPNGSATIYVEAIKSEGQWVYHVLSVHVDGTGERIDLLE